MKNIVFEIIFCGRMNFNASNYEESISQCLDGTMLKVK